MELLFSRVAGGFGHFPFRFGGLEILAGPGPPLEEALFPFELVDDQVEIGQCFEIFGLRLADGFALKSDQGIAPGSPNPRPDMNLRDAGRKRVTDDRLAELMGLDLSRGLRLVHHRPEGNRFGFDFNGHGLGFGQADRFRRRPEPGGSPPRSSP